MLETFWAKVGALMVLPINLALVLPPVIVSYLLLHTRVVLGQAGRVDKTERARF